MASWERRLCAYLIDLILVYGVALKFGFHSTTGVWVATAFMLLRDIGGASPGKLAAGVRVTGRDGGPANLAQRVLRNAVLGLQGAAYALTPLAGMGALGLLVRLGPSGLFLVDGFWLVSKGERLSDRIFGTMVVTRRGPA
jgi:uncharacterized RDD family membrane protein YckC